VEPAFGFVGDARRLEMSARGAIEPHAHVVTGDLDCRMMPLALLDPSRCNRTPAGEKRGRQRFAHGFFVISKMLLLMKLIKNCFCLVSGACARGVGAGHTKWRIALYGT